MTVCVLIEIVLEHWVHRSGSTRTGPVESYIMVWKLLNFSFGGYSTFGIDSFSFLPAIT